MRRYELGGESMKVDDEPGQNSGRQGRCVAADSGDGIPYVDLRTMKSGSDLASALQNAFDSQTRVCMHSRHIEAVQWWLEVDSGQSFIPSCCVHIDMAAAQCWHEEQVLHLPLHVLQLLSLFEKSEDRVITLQECNTAAGARGWNGWTRSSFQAAVHTLRVTFPDHIISVRSVGYYFHPCVRSSEWKDKGQENVSPW